MLGICGDYCMAGDESFTACRRQFPEKEMLNLCKHSDHTLGTSDSSLSAFAGVPGHQQGTFEHGRECTAFPDCFVVDFHEHHANFFTACRRHSGVEARLDVQGPAEIVLDPYLQILMGADASFWSSTTAQLASKLWHCSFTAPAFLSWAQQPFWHMRKVSRTCSGIDSMLPSIAEGSLSLKHVKVDRQSLGNSRTVYDAYHFLETLAVSIATFVRTAALCSMLALWRLLFYAIPKKGGRYNADPLVSAGRSATRWVPLSLLWVVWIPGVQCSNPDFWNELSIIDRDIQIAESITRRTEVQHAPDPPPPPLLTRSTVEPDHDLDRPWFEDAELQQEELQAWPEEPWLATAVVYNFQATPECISCWVQGDWGENDALQAMSEYLLEDDEDRMLYPLRPQPCDDCVHLFTTAAWIVGQFTPIVIDCTQCGGGRFLAHVGNEVRLDDIQGIMGPDWPRGAQVWQLSERAAARRLGEDDMVTTMMGGVFTITPRNELPTEWEPLGTRMRHPWTWARDVHTHGLPTFDRGIQNVQLFGTNTWGRLLRMPDLDLAGRRQFVAQMLDMHPDGIELCSPSRRLRFYEVRGRRCPDQLGVKSTEFEHLSGVFLDPRDIGSEVTFLALPPQPMTLDRICEYANVPLPAGWQLSVEGAVLYTPRSRMVTFGQRTVLTIVVHPYDIEPPEEDGLDGSNHEWPSSGEHDGDAPHHSDGGHDDDRSRSPRRHDADGPGGTHELAAIILPVRRDSHNVSDELSGFSSQGTILDEAKAALQAGDFDSLIHSICSLQRHHKAALCLDKLIGPQVFDLEKGSVYLEGDWDAVFRLQRSWQDFAPLLDLRCLPLHDSTRRALRDCLYDFHPDLFKRGWKCTMHVDGSAKNGKSGWAVCIVLINDSVGLKIFHGLFGAAIHAETGRGLNLGERQGESLDAEQTALVWALLWVVQASQGLGLPMPVEIAFDNKSAGDAADGRCQLAECSRLSEPSRGLMQLIEQLPDINVTTRHVHSHRGDPWNELVDITAKVLTGVLPYNGPVIPAPPTEVAEAFRRINWQWAWMSSRQGWTDQPRICRGALESDPVTDKSRLNPHDIIHYEESTHGWDHCTQSFPIHAISANVQSLWNKHKYLEEQISSMGVDILMLQETKMHGGYCESRGYLRFETESRRRWGVAIWIARTLDRGHKKIEISKEDITVVSSQPRFLAVLLSKGSIKALLISMHVPHQSRPLEERAQVFDAFRKAVDQHGYVPFVLAGIDSNSRVPILFPGVTGDIPFGGEDECGWRFAELLSSYKLWLPSTFHDYHTGQNATWVHSGGIESRIDFLAVGGQVDAVQTSSYVAVNLDLLTLNQDHWGVGVVVFPLLPDRIRAKGRLRKPKYDRARLLSADGRQIFQDAVRGLPQIPWNTHPDIHARELERQITAILGEHFTRSPEGPRAGYIGEDVWRMRAKKLQAKRRMRCRWEGLPQVRLQATLQTWRLGTGLIPIAVRRMTLMADLLRAAVGYCTAWTKKRIKQDKSGALQNFLRGLGEMKPQQLLKALTEFGLGSKQRKQGRKVPFNLKDADGNMISGREALDSLWIEHFGAMEHGSVKDAAAFLKEVPDLEQIEPAIIEIPAIPTRLEVETVFRQAPARKAMGLDLIPPEVFKTAPKEMTQIYYGLYLKCMLFARTPIQWAGGILQEAYKHQGSTADPASYRSLYLASQPGKLFQKALRKKVTTTMRRELHSLHCGPKQGAPVTLPAMAVHLLNRLFRAKGIASAILCLDTKSAYYRTVRQLAVGQLDTEEGTIHMFREFGLDPDDYQDFLRLTKEGGCLGEAGVGPHLLEMSKDLCRRTWFVTNYTSGSKICHVQAGSRPGSSWADVLFGFVYARLLAKIRQEAAHNDFDTPLQYSGIKELIATSERPNKATVRICDATWADDTTICTFDAKPQRLLQKAEAMIASTLKQCRRYGLVPNLKRGKTALIVALRGKGARTAAAATFKGDQRTLRIRSEGGGVDEIYVEANYLHLGGMLCRNADMTHEARRRTSIARAAFEASKKQLLGNKHISRECRAMLFRSLVASTYHNLELWTTNETAWPQLQRGYEGLAKKLLSCEIFDLQYFRLTAHEALCLAHVQPLQLRARLKRLTFLQNLVQQGQDEMWAIVQLEGSWARAAWEDLTWLREWSGETLPPVTAEHWPEWWHVLNAPTGALKRRAKQAAQKWWRAQQARAATDLLLKDLVADAGMATGDENGKPPAEVWCCPPCRRGFQSRAALAAHFRKCHERCAAHRYYAIGSVCRACGTDYHSQRRLLLHLRHSSVCCDVLAALGLKSEQPQEGIKRWKQQPTADFVLCPPERRLAASQAAPSSNRKWQDNPSMEQAFWEIMDQLIYFEGADVQQMVCQAVDVLRKFPLYKDECRLIFDRLARSAKHLILEEEMELWEAATPQGVWSAFAQLAREFECWTFLEDCMPQPVSRVIPNCRLRDIDMWRGLVSAFPGSNGLLKHLQIGEPNQGTCQSMTVERCGAVEAVEMWHLNAWGKVGSVTVELLQYKEEGMYLRTRHALFPSLGKLTSDIVAHALLRICWQFAMRGGLVAIEAPRPFWLSEAALPFRALSEHRALFHSN